MARKSILGEVVILNESARSAAEAAAGHPHAVFPTIYSELLRSTRARPLKVGD